MTDFYTIPELERRWGVGRKRVLATIQQGGIPAVRLPPNSPKGKLLVRRDAVDQFEQRQAPPPPPAITTRYPER